MPREAKFFLPCLPFRAYCTLFPVVRKPLGNRPCGKMTCGLALWDIPSGLSCPGESPIEITRRHEVTMSRLEHAKMDDLNPTWLVPAGFCQRFVTSGCSRDQWIRALEGLREWPGCHSSPGRELSYADSALRKKLRLTTCTSRFNYGQRQNEIIW